MVCAEKRAKCSHFGKDLVKESPGNSVSNFQTNRGGEEAEQEKAEWIVGDELKRTGWEEKDLPDQPKGAKAKVAMA